MFVYVTVTWAPADAFNVSVSNASEFSAGVITVNCAVLDCVTGAVVAVGRALGWAIGCAPVADAPIFSATSWGELARPTGTSRISPATEMNPLIPPGARQLHTCFPDARSNACTSPANVEVNTRSPATVAPP